MNQNGISRNRGERFLFCVVEYLSISGQYLELTLQP